MTHVRGGGGGRVGGRGWLRAGGVCARTGEQGQRGRAGWGVELSVSEAPLSVSEG